MATFFAASLLDNHNNPMRESHMMTRFALTSLAAGVALATLATHVQAQEEWTMTTTWPDNLDLIQIDRHWQNWSTSWPATSCRSTSAPAAP